jgi:NAD(P)-dependent dehydrogenase (short-subunit alcohol dehydrogenase family)
MCIRDRGKSCIAYATAKAGVIGFTKYLAMELGPFGITVNAVSPGTTLTERVRAIRSDEDIERLVAKIPLKRLGMPEDSVNAICFLSSDDAGYITGVTLDVTGGIHMN